MVGSCTRHPIKEFSRASWGYVQVNQGTERLQVSVSGPIWGPMPQTPQSGEFGALAMVGNNLSGPAQGFSDCKNVVEMFKLPVPDKFNFKRMYAGTMILAQSPWLESVSKVKAHVADDPSLSAFQKWEKFGNDEAGRAARAGNAAHPVGTPAELD